MPNQRILYRIALVLCIFVGVQKTALPLAYAARPITAGTHAASLLTPAPNLALLAGIVLPGADFLYSGSNRTGLIIILCVLFLLLAVVAVCILGGCFLPCLFPFML
jgi:hypothetical protein